MRYSAGIFLLFFASLHTWAQSSPLLPFEMPQARAAGSGGYHAAYADDISALFANPAILSSCEGQIAIAELSLSAIDTGMFGLYIDYVVNMPQKSYVTNIQDGQKNTLDLGGPLGVGILYKGFGAALYNVTRSGMVKTKDAALRAEFSEEFLVTAGYGLKLFDTGNVRGELGLTGKFFYRFLSAKDNINVLGIQDFLEDVNKYPLETQMGGGADLGARLTAGTFSIGVSVHDPYSPASVTGYENRAAFGGTAQSTGTANVKTRLSAGIAWQPSPPFGKSVISEFLLTLDCHNILAPFDEDERSILLEFALGFEVRLINNVSFRAAINELMPAAGLGFDFGLFKLDAAIRMTECGNDIWQYPALAFNLSFLYRYRFPPVRDEPIQ
ncbi:MAG: hypothetical protein LBG72_01165 [Spirochaetaceae bacterium]|jgi:hypothetical protein|nr:hypothetical protein [Spirochaetaceae bacterium]